MDVVFRRTTAEQLIHICQSLSSGILPILYNVIVKNLFSSEDLDWLYSEFPWIRIISWNDKSDTICKNNDIINAK